VTWKHKLNTYVCRCQRLDDSEWSGRECDRSVLGIAHVIKLVRVPSWANVVEVEPRGVALSAARLDLKYLAGGKLTNKLLIGYLCRVKLNSHALGVSCGATADLLIFGICCLLIAIAVTNGRIEVREILQENMFGACKRR